MYASSVRDCYARRLDRGSPVPVPLTDDNNFLCWVKSHCVPLRAQQSQRRGDHRTLTLKRSGPTHGPDFVLPHTTVTQSHCELQPVRRLKQLFCRRNANRGRSDSIVGADVDPPGRAVSGSLGRSHPRGRDSPLGGGGDFPRDGGTARGLEGFGTGIHPWVGRAIGTRSHSRAQGFTRDEKSEDLRWDTQLRWKPTL